MEVKRFAVVFSVIGMVCTQSWAGVVTFSNNGTAVNDANPLVVLLENAGPVQFDVSVNADQAIYDTAIILLGSANVPITNFTLSPTFGPTPGGYFATIEGPFPTGMGPGIYVNELYVGGSITPRPTSPGPDPLLIGTLTADLTNLGEGDYTLFVDSVQDGGLSAIAGATVESLTGLARISIVPEPATLSLLGLGLLAVLRRRRAN